MILGIIIDILLVAIVLIGAFIGIKKGFVKIAAKPVKFFASLGLAILICTGVAEAVVAPMIEEPIANYVSEFLYSNCENVTAENAADELPTLLKISAAIFNIDIAEVTEGAGNAVLDAIVENLTTPVINVVSVIIAFVLVYIAASILFSIALMLINLIFSNGILGVFNRTLGFVFTGAVFLIISWALAVLLEFVFHLPAFEGVAFINDFNGGFIYNFFNTYSPIELLLSF